MRIELGRLVYNAVRLVDGLSALTHALQEDDTWLQSKDDSSGQPRDRIERCAFASGRSETAVIFGAGKTAYIA